MSENVALVSAILQELKAITSKRALLVGISGIDGSGKSFITEVLQKELRNLGWNVAAIAADNWHNLPSVCIDRSNPAEHFYKHALRMEEMFARVVLPLKQSRHIDVIADCGDAKATVHRKQRYYFSNIDIVLLEGIFLFKPAYRGHFDLKVWIDCSFKTALQRAIARGQEGLPPKETKHAFETIYFPAQRIHLQQDNPRHVADIVFDNDTRL